MSFLIGLKHWAPFLIFSIILIVVPIVSGAPFYSGIIAWAVIFLILFIYATSEGIRVNYGYFAAYCESKRRLDGHCAIVTGANSGVGYATSKELIRRGCNVIITARSQAKIDKTIESINNELGISDSNGDSGDNNKFGNVESVILDLSSKTSIDSAIDKIINQYCPKYDINILINNAGAWLTNASITKDGNIDTQWQANYFAPFYMTKKLLPYIKKAAQKLNHGRIINVTSSEHRRGNFTIFNGFLDHQSRSDLNFWKSQSTLDVYGNTKCAQIMHAAVLQAILDSETNDNDNDNSDNNGNNDDMSENEKKLDSYQNEAANGSNNNNNVLYIMAAHPGFVDSGFVNSKTRSLVVKIFYPLFVYPFFYSFAYLTNEQGAQTSLYCVLSDRKDIKPGGFHAHCEINDTHSNVENVISSKKDELYKVSSMIWEQQMP